jgi:hypothetical protein
MKCTVTFDMKDMLPSLTAADYAELVECYVSAVKGALPRADNVQCYVEIPLTGNVKAQVGTRGEVMK